MSVEDSNIARCFSKINELRDIDSIGCRARNITIQKWEIDWENCTISDSHMFSENRTFQEDIYFLKKKLEQNEDMKVF